VSHIDGDWTFYSIQGPIEQTPAADLIGGPFWAGLAAVKAGRAVQVDDDPWYLNAGPAAAMVVLRDLEKAIVGGR
jgi:iron complex transport system substrate-binding protein